MSQGVGRKRRIMLAGGKPSHSLRVEILEYESLALTEGYMVTLQHMLKEAGHTPFFSNN